MKVRKKKRHLFLRIAVLAFSVYVVVVLVQLKLQLDDLEAKKAALEENIAKVELLNEDLANQAKKENLDDYLEQQAREDGYSYPGEIILTESAGAK